MQTEQIAEKLAARVAEHLCLPPAEVQAGMSFESLGADSLDMYELAMALEEDFNIDLADDEIDAIVTVDDAVKLIAAKTATEACA